MRRKVKCRWIVNGTMKKMALFALIMAGMVSHSIAQQNIQFTQYMFNMLSVNPAYAGYKENWNLQATSRLQWQGLVGAPQTSQLSVDGVADEDAKRMGLGLQFTNDKLGAQSATSLYANYSYRLPLDEYGANRLCLGLAAGVTQYGIDGSVLEAVNSDDPDLISDKLYSYIPDLRFGVFYNTPTWYAGLSFMDLLSGSKSNSIFNWQIDSTENIMRKPHYYFITGAIFDISRDVKLRPSLLVKSDMKGPTSWDLSALFIIQNRFWVGASYRTAAPELGINTTGTTSLSKTNSISGIVQFYVTESFCVGYSYDLTISKLSSVQNGTHEITIGWTFPRKYQRVLSPRFF